MIILDARQRRELDRHITGNYGENQFPDDVPVDGEEFSTPDPASDGPECDIIKRILMRFPALDISLPGRVHQ